MRKFFSSLLTAGFLSLLLVQSAAFSQEVASVDVQKVVMSSKQIADLKKEQETQAKELVNFVEKARKAVSAESDLNKKKTLEEKYNKEFLAKRNKIEDAYTAKLKKIDADISAEIAKQAQAQGIDMVISKEIVLYGNKDITDSVIKALKESKK